MGLLRECLLACHHLVDDRAKRKNVAARVGRVAFELFRRHVLQRAGDRAFPGNLRRTHCRLGVGRRIGEERPRRFGQSEVEQLHARLRDHHVRRLEIAMDDAVAVRGVQRVGNLDGVAQRLRHRHGASGQPRRQRLAVEQLHHEVLDIAGAADVVERADVGMRELRDRARFALESLARVRRRGEIAGQHFDRDETIEPRVARLVDGAHRPGADRADDLERSEPASTLEVHAGSLRQLPRQRLVTPKLGRALMSRGGRAGADRSDDLERSGPASTLEVHGASSTRIAEMRASASVLRATARQTSRAMTGLPRRPPPLAPSGPSVSYGVITPSLGEGGKPAEGGRSLG
jgi:hypothetical protein